VGRVDFAQHLCLLDDEAHRLLEIALLLGGDILLEEDV